MLLEATVLVLLACEFSGAVRRAFRAAGHEAWSCDFLPAEDGASEHIQTDVRTLLNEPWDLMIAFPPCTYLAASGMRWLSGKDKQKDRELRMQEAVEFFLTLRDAPIPRIAIENPVGIMSTIWRKPDQVIQPYQFGHEDSKGTCLWLKNLPLLQPTQIVVPKKIGKSKGSLTHRLTLDLPTELRRKERSRTYNGIAKAMATQWGKL